jgi:hypothetical protein
LSFGDSKGIYSKSYVIGVAPPITMTPAYQFISIPLTEANFQWSAKGCNLTSIWCIQFSGSASPGEYALDDMIFYCDPYEISPYSPLPLY